MEDLRVERLDSEEKAPQAAQFGEGDLPGSAAALAEIPKSDEAAQAAAEVAQESRPGGPENSKAPELPCRVSEEPLSDALPEPVAGQPAMAVETAAALALEDQLRRIQAMDPEVQSWEDVMNGPQAADFTRLVRRGCTPAEAFQVTQFDKIVGRRVAAARRAALQSAYGKAHLRATSAAMGDEFPVPFEVEQQYRAFFPGWSEAQIRADFRKRR